MTRDVRNGTRPCLEGNRRPCIVHGVSELSVGWVDPWVGLGRVASGLAEIF